MKPDDEIRIEIKFNNEERWKYCATYFTREFFDSAMFAHTHFHETLESLGIQALSMFLDVSEERVHELLQEESQPQTKEGEGQLQPEE